MKSLLIARRPAATATGSSSSPSSSYSNALPDTPAPTNASGINRSSSSSSATPATSVSGSTGLLGARKPGIPAWQMRGSASSTASGTATAAEPAPASAQSAAAEEDTSASGVLVEKPSVPSTAGDTSAATTGEANKIGSTSASASGVQIEETKDDGRP